MSFISEEKKVFKSFNFQRRLNPVNSLTNDKISDWSKLKAYAEDKINVTEKMKFVFERVENMVEKEENVGYQHFLLFQSCFPKASYTVSLKVWIV